MTTGTSRHVARQDADPRPKLIFVGPDPEGQGGMATVCKTLLGSSLAQRYAMTMIVSHEVGSVARRIRVFMAARAQLDRALEKEPAAAIVHIHTAARGSMYRKAMLIRQAHRHGAYVVVHLHTGAGEIGDFGGSLGRLRRGFFTRTLKLANLIVCASRSTAVELERQFAVAGSLVFDNPLPSPVPEEIGDRPGNGAVLYLGGFANPVKGAAVMLDALRLLAARGETLRASMAGDGQPSADAQDLATWVGWLDTSAKRRAISSASIVAIPSTSEGLPIALLEAMAYGKAIVASAVGAIPEVVTDGVNGLLVAPGAANELADALEKLAADPDLRARMGDEARRRARDFSLERAVDKLDGLYRQMLADGATG